MDAHDDPHTEPLDPHIHWGFACLLRLGKNAGNLTVGPEEDRAWYAKHAVPYFAAMHALADEFGVPIKTRIAYEWMMGDGFGGPFAHLIGTPESVRPQLDFFLAKYGEPLPREELPEYE